jgi:drug/metabolite transporter superfamily protein YnfA
MATIIHVDFIRQHPTQAGLTVLGLSGVAAVFLPFVETYVPLGVVLDPPEEDLALRVSVGPFVVLPFVIFTGYLRWLLTGYLSRWERALAYALALIGALSLPVYGVLYESSGSLDKDALLWLLPLLVVYAANAWFIAQSERNDTSSAPRALAAMQLVYLVFALFWLTLLITEPLFDEAGSGAYLAAVTVVVYTLQAALLVRGRRWKLLKLTPLALVWGMWAFMGWIG